MLRWALQLAACILLAQALTSAQSPSLSPDSDKDGIADAGEQALLQKFRPTLLVSPKDCALLPAEFTSGLTEPAVAARNGAIYGQVFAQSPDTLEIHYYVLWDRDCGRNGHALDVEHVAALLMPGSVLEPEHAKAAFWYAGAHEDTICDTSTASRASALGAEERGPKIWTSSGKHAMFLAERDCGRGCGGDSCSDNRELPAAAPVINIGEVAAPMNGALWVANKQWPLATKMASDFPPEVVIAINAAPPDKVIKVGSKGSRATRAVVLGGDTSLDGIASGARHTGNALGIADRKASSSVSGAVKKAYRWVTRTPEKKPEKK